ncbi:MAG: ornithine carbamoyltransferase [Phycisphaerae bacterium]
MPRHFLNVDDFSPAETRALLDLAVELKAEHAAGGNRPRLAGRVLAMLFEKPSLRTRVSFEVAMVHLGGHALNIRPDEVGLGTREPPEDVARVLGGMSHCIMARVFEHTTLQKFADASPVPVVNGLSDASHPCQALADVLTLREHFGELAGRKVAYVGDGNNVAQSLMDVCRQLEMPFALATPAGYELPGVPGTNDPAEAVAWADCIYTDTWTSMGQEEQKQQRLQDFAGFEVNAELLAKAKRDAVVLHCLPAYRGYEISAEVLEHPRSLVFLQAHNRLHAQKALLATLLA